MPKRTECRARQYSDQMQCAQCGLAWDTNDPEPPQCGRVPKEAGRRTLRNLRRMISKGRAKP